LVAAVALLLAFMSGTAISQTPSPAPSSSSDQGIGLRLLFKFETEEAKLAALALAAEKLLDFEIKDYKVAVITVTSLEVLQALKALDGIEFAEADSARTKSPYNGDDSSSPHDYNAINRRLEEHQPYGIAMIQADQLWGLTPVGEVDVCVVDTGIEDGHEDLPNSIVSCW
jgi:subtilisin family serine protease